MKYIIKKICFLSIIILIIGGVFITKYLRKDNTFNSLELKNFSNTEVISTNSFWCSTFQIAWEKLKSELNLSKIEFIDEENELVNKLNNTTFGLNSISDSGYYLFVDNFNSHSKSIINRELRQKFNIKAKIFDTINLENTNGKIIYSYLEKKYTFENEFETKNKLYIITNKNNDIIVKSFGIPYNGNDNLLKNIESTYYIDHSNFGISLNTKENEEIIFIMTDAIEDDFELLWQQYQENQKIYKCEFTNKNTLAIPYIKIEESFNYDNLCNKYIKDTNGEYISYAIQNIKFSLNESGGELENEVLVTTEKMSAVDDISVSYSFYKPFIIFIKEKNKEEPYFALKIYDESFLVINN